jgi:hypothetical protein
VNPKLSRATLLQRADYNLALFSRVDKGLAELIETAVKERKASA